MRYIISKKFLKRIKEARQCCCTTSFRLTDPGSHLTATRIAFATGNHYLEPNFIFSENLLNFPSEAFEYISYSLASESFIPNGRPFTRRINF